MTCFTRIPALALREGPRALVLVEPQHYSATQQAAARLLGQHPHRYRICRTQLRMRPPTARRNHPWRARRHSNNLACVIVPPGVHILCELRLRENLTRLVSRRAQARRPGGVHAMCTRSARRGTFGRGRASWRSSGSSAFGSLWRSGACVSGSRQAAGDLPDTGNSSFPDGDGSSTRGCARRDGSREGTLQDGRAMPTGRSSPSWSKGASGCSNSFMVPVGVQLVGHFSAAPPQSTSYHVDSEGWSTCLEHSMRPRRRFT